jgi:GNAT superfamily N-acetyltransferase
VTETVIRPATGADRDAIIGLIHALNCFEATVEDNRDIRLAAAIAGYEATVSDTAREKAMFVAEQDGAVAGYICIVIDMAPYYVKQDERRHVRIADLIVAEGARGRGIGRALIARAEAFARENGICRLLIGALAGNHTANDLYATLGFRPYVIERIKALD